MATELEEEDLLKKVEQMAAELEETVTAEQLVEEEDLL